MSFRDDWPKMPPDDTDFDGKQLLALVRSSNSPFDGAWDVNLIIREIEGNLGTEVIDIPAIYKGSNNYVSSYYNLYNLILAKTKARWHTGFLLQAIESTGHRGTFGSRRY